MSARITKQEAHAAARVIEWVLAGSLKDAEFVHDDEDTDRLATLLHSVSQKLWNRT